MSDQVVTVGVFGGQLLRGYEHERLNDLYDHIVLAKAANPWIEYSTICLLRLIHSTKLSCLSSDWAALVLTSDWRNIILSSLKSFDRPDTTKRYLTE